MHFLCKGELSGYDNLVGAISYLILGRKYNFIEWLKYLGRQYCVFVTLVPFAEQLI